MLAVQWEHSTRTIVRSMLEGDARAVEAAAELGEDATRRRPCASCGLPTLGRARFASPVDAGLMLPACGKCAALEARP
jgi:hypothetical protein